MFALRAIIKTEKQEYTNKCINLAQFQFINNGCEKQNKGYQHKQPFLLEADALIDGLFFNKSNIGNNFKESPKKCSDDRRKKTERHH
jgi:hypothetical protein